MIPPVHSPAPGRDLPTGRPCGTAVNPKVSVTFDADVFAEIRRRAADNGATFAEQVRRILREALS